ncbi:helix-turn-helix transcriptional regulator [Psychrobium sp. 1_MG-2023]|uniref:helix-turn-helix domain-containing protein n=1 Tax=Psychrobium sp. 1_MG-2023 TaxID=3062624 RepID=UPI000C32F9AA|nr:helix-turn-helix transcriptional regulator [Psychrobium sp. 1_MG-2023]MDP2561501.1 helix-turn-helix transcriptional regulator [Psychrobium sp. 1_MG-2023]PKF57767.1 hypothetical protein CW748_06110 [Alteromonadales bacterium alter-6D02]
MDFASQLLTLRQNKQWTQKEAAAAIDIQQSYLSKLENGLFQPSDEVIDKICVAYAIDKKTLVPSLPSHGVSLYARFGIVAIIGVGLLSFLLGYFSLLYPTTYYTYQAQPSHTMSKAPTGLKQTSLVQAPSEQATHVYYHLTDQYLGDKYIQAIANTPFVYTLIAEREISSSENNGLMAFGVFIFIFGIGYILLLKLLT